MLRSVPPALQSREFRLLLSGQAVSRIGNGVYEATLGLIVFSSVGSAVTMSTVLVAFIAPQLLLTVRAGVLSDRLDRRRLLIGSDLLAAAVTGAVAAAAGVGRLTPLLLILLSLGIGMAAAVVNPAYGPLLSRTVPQRYLAEANGLDAAVTNGANLTAPALGSRLFAAGGAAWALGANSLSFVLAAACTALLRPARHTPSTPVESISPASDEPIDDRGAGVALRYLRTSRWLRPLLALALFTNLLVLGPFFVMLPWRVTDQRLPTITLGLAVSVQAASALLTSLLISRHPSEQPGRTFIALSTAFPVALVILLLVDGVGGVLVSAALVGIGMASGVLENLMLQAWVPDRLRGRVYSFDVLVSLCTIPVGYLLAGVVIDNGSAAVTSCAGACITLAGAAWALSSGLARHRLADERRPVEV